MIDLNKLDVFKNEFLDFLKSRSQGSLGMDDLYLEEGCSIKDSIEDSHKKLDFAIDLFLKAKEAGSLVDIAAALISVRVYMSDISGVLGGSIDDLDFFIKSSGDIVIPEDYKFPEY